MNLHGGNVENFQILASKKSSLEVVRPEKRTRRQLLLRKRVITHFGKANL